MTTSSELLDIRDTLRESNAQDTELLESWEIVSAMAEALAEEERYESQREWVEFFGDSSENRCPPRD